MSTRAYSRGYRCAYVRTCVQAWVKKCGQTCVQTRVQTCVRTYVRAWARMYTSTCAGMGTYMCTDMCVYMCHHCCRGLPTDICNAQDLQSTRGRRIHTRTNGACVCVCACRSLRLSAYSCACLSAVCPSLSVRLSICPPVRLSICRYVHPVSPFPHTRAHTRAIYTQQTGTCWSDFDMKMTFVSHRTHCVYPRVGAGARVRARAHKRRIDS